MNNIIERKWKQGGMVNIEDLRGTAFQAEELAHTFRIRGVNESGAEITLSGSVGAVFLRADNTDVAITGTVTDGAAVITLPEECYDIPGRFGLTVYLTSGDHTVAIYAAIGSVSRTSSGNVSSGSAENIADLINAINAAIESIPPDYSELSREVSDIQGQADIHSDVIYGKEAVTITNTSRSAWNIEAGIGGTAAQMSSTGAFNASAPIPVTPGQIYKVTGCQGQTDKIRLWTVTDDEYTILAMADNHKGTNDISELFTVPDGGTLLLLSCWNTTIHPQSAQIWKPRLKYTDKGLLSDAGITELTECHENGIYRTTSQYVSSITDLPDAYTNKAFMLFVTNPAFANERFSLQKLVSNDFSEWRRIITLENGEWTVYPGYDWIKTVSPDALSRVPAEPIRYVISQKNGYIKANDGTVNSGSSLTRWAATDFIEIEGYEYLIYSRCVVTGNSTDGGIAFYSSNDAETYLSGDYMQTRGTNFGIVEQVIKVPTGAKYVRMSLITEAGFYIKGIKSNPLKGLKMSLLGASMETFAGAIPEGNDVYYTGSNHGIKNVNEMWWKALCNNTGMIPLVIDAWSGSAVCYNYATDSAHADTAKIPMCSDLRTGRLGTQDEDPDIILIVGGTNDWTYSKETTTPLGNWNGRTAVDRQAVVSGQSTFMESYASMIAKLQENYPNAVLVGLSTEFVCRGTDLGITRVNDMGFTESDYSDAIERVCKIMGIPFIDVYNVGFNYETYANIYASEDTSATHMNAKGHAVIAKRMIEELPKVVKQIKG